MTDLEANNFHYPFVKYLDSHRKMCSEVQYMEILLTLRVSNKFKTLF